MKANSLKRHLVVAVASVLVCASAFGWWSDGHALIDHAAVLALPHDMPGFFRDGSSAIVSYSTEPDLWSLRSFQALRSAQRADHFLDLELLAGKRLPPTRGEYFVICRGLRLHPDEVGTLPYAIQEYYERLVLAFAAHRKWPDDEGVKAQVLFLAGVLSHYAGDACQPLHCTVHYDGRAKRDAASPRTGIHLKMDALPGQAKLAPAEVARDLEVKASRDVFALTLWTIRQSNLRVDRVYELESWLPSAEDPIADRLAAENRMDARVRALALDCTRAAAGFTAALWYSAWKNSARVELPAWYTRGKRLSATTE